MHERKMSENFKLFRRSYNHKVSFRTASNNNDSFYSFTPDMTDKKDYIAFTTLQKCSDMRAVASIAVDSTVILPRSLSN